MNEIKHRFLQKVNKSSGCWIWTGAVCSHGYGGFAVTTGPKKQKHYLAHRIAWIIYKGKIPDGMCVLHDCPGGDNPLCVNPDHLWLGTKHENSQDASKKGRIFRMPGSKNHKSKLTESDFTKIVELYQQGWTQWDIADRFHVHQGTIGKLLLGKTWKHMITK